MFLFFMVLIPILGFSQNTPTEKILSNITFIKVEQAKKLINEGADPNYIDPANKVSLLMKSLKEGNIDLAKALINAGADLYYQSPDLENSLTLATKFGHRELFPLLKEKGVDFSKPDNQHLLLLSAYYGHTAIMKKLLDYGADPKFKDSYGDTALILASKQNHVRIIKILLKHDSNLINIRNNKGNSALGEAVKNNYPTSVKELLKYKPNLEITNKDGENLIFLAITKDNVEIIKILTKLSPQLLSYKNSNQDTALIYASKENQLKSAKELVKYIDINAQNKQGDSALLYATRYEFLPMAKFFLEEGADPYLTNQKGETAFELAQKERNFQLVNLIKNQDSCNCKIH